MVKLILEKEKSQISMKVELFLKMLKKMMPRKIEIILGKKMKKMQVRQSIVSRTPNLMKMKVLKDLLLERLLELQLQQTICPKTMTKIML